MGVYQRWQQIKSRKKRLQIKRKHGNRFQSRQMKLKEATQKMTTTTTFWQNITPPLSSDLNLLHATSHKQNNNNNNSSQSNNYGSTSHRVELESNHIYFYSEVSRDKILTLIQFLNKVNYELTLSQERSGGYVPRSSTDRRHQLSTQQQEQLPKIYLHINSDGGDVSSAFVGADMIRASRFPVVSIVEGSAASAATLLSIAADRRLITRHSFMLIHEISAMFSCRYSDISQHSRYVAREMRYMKRLYRQYTKITTRKLKDALQSDHWWSAAQCLALGMVDEMI